jgi:hemoglobin/transferrin/lactoferrin receptor protein
MLAASLFLTGAMIMNMGAARAQDQAPVSVSVPAGTLESGLLSLGKQANLKLVYASALTTGKQTGGVSGQLTSQAAVEQLLAGTGLSFSFTGVKTVRIFDPSAANDAGATVDGAIALDTIDVSGGAADSASGSGFQGTPDWVYQTPASVSVVSREAIENSASRNARDLLDTVSGVWVNRTEAQNPGIAVNIRGLGDQNRVVTMIDGARQNFQRNSHGSTQRTYVDTAFIREIDIEKSGTSSVGGAGALGGSVNFRTLGVDDLVADGETFGGEVNAATGTNAYNFSGSASLAFKLSESISVLGGISHKDLGEYAIGQNGIEAYTRPILGNIAQPMFTGSETWSGLLKTEIDLSEDTQLTLGWMRYQAESSQGDVDEDSAASGEHTQDIVNDTFTASLNWDDDSELIDLKARVWNNALDNEEVRPTKRLYPETHVDYSFATTGGSLENTSRFDLQPSKLALNYGFEAFRDRGDTKAMSAAIAANPQLAAGFAGLNPGGTRDVASGFANATLDYQDWLTVSGGARYDWYRMQGTATWYHQRQETVCTRYLFNDEFGIPTPPDQDICIAFVNNNIITPKPQRVDQSEGALLPTAMIAVKPTDWLQPFMKYSQSFRPPTIMETFVGGGHPGTIGIEFAPNPDLKPESARTFEFGANIAKDGVFATDDAFRLKMVRFDRSVEDYILVGTIMPDGANKPYNTFLNVNGTTVMRGAEVEANYDAGFYYVGAAYTWLDTEWSKDYTYQGTIQTSTTGDVINSIYVPPNRKLTIDAGVRLVDQKLVLGGRLTDVGVAKEHFGQLGGYPTRDYRIYDLYGSYAFTDDVKLRFTIDNVTDVAYVPALGEWAYPAPGRTATTSLNIKY